MRIGIIADWLNPTMEEMIQLVAARGVVVDVIYPERQLTNLAHLRVDHDLYLLKSGTEPALSFGGALHALGAVTLNPYPTVAMMRNKVIVTRALQAAGVPTPNTYMTTRPQDFAPLLEAGPLILKPYRGSRGAGVRVLQRADELADLPEGELLLAQDYHAPDGLDHKLFRIGDEIFGVRRVWPIRTYTDKLGEPFDPSPELCEIALRCGEAFGIDLYGLDVIMSQGQPYVVDVNKFGSYMGVPQAARCLADHVYASAERAARREEVVPMRPPSDPIMS